MTSPIRRWRKKFELGHRLYYATPWAARAWASAETPIIIGGCDRSGTTLLRAAMDTHPDVVAGPESWVFCYRVDPVWLAEEYGFDPAFVRQLKRDSSCLGEFIERFFGAYRDREGARVWCEKSPRNIVKLPYIWKLFPNARVVHIIRDGRDVSCSLRTHPKRIRVNGEYVPNTVRRPIKDCIDHWVNYVSAGIAHRGDERYMELRYEELIDDYEGATRRLCAHVGLEWTPAILAREQSQTARTDVEIVNPEVRQPLYTSAVARWKTDLSDDEKRTIEARAGELLARLGYTSHARTNASAA